MKPRIGNGLIVLALVTGVVLLGVAGVSLAASGHGASASQSEQAPIGEFSAGGSPGTGRVPGDTEGGSKGEAEGGSKGDTEGGSKGDTESGSKGDTESGVKGDTESGSGPDTVSSADGSGGGSAGGSLPFTGFLAIPVLLLGLMLLVAGVVLRRRSSEPTRP